jgi:hypothetical protein
MPKNTLAAKKLSGGDPPGACFITDPQTGEQKCHFITKSECDSRQGTFLGGLCPPDMSAEPMTALKRAVKAAKAVKPTKVAKAAKAAKSAKTAKAAKAPKTAKTEKKKETKKRALTRKKKRT